MIKYLNLFFSVVVISIAGVIIACLFSAEQIGWGYFIGSVAICCALILIVIVLNLFLTIKFRKEEDSK